MSQTITLKGTPKVPGAFESQTIRWQGDASYPAATGYVLTPASFGFNRIQRVFDPICNTAASAAWDPVLVPTYDATGDFIVSLALRLIVQTTGVEVANTVTVATSDFNIIAEGN